MYLKIRVAYKMRSVEDANNRIDILTPTKQVPDVHSKVQNTNQNVIENQNIIPSNHFPQLAISVNLAFTGIVTLK